MRRTERGFTLIEVLAAVAVLGLLYTVLAEGAMQALRAEGVSKRRLEASLLADSRLAEVELELEGNSVPAVGATESEEDDFRVVVTVEPFDLMLPGLGAEDEKPGPLLGDLTQDRSSPLRKIEVRVFWFEGQGELKVVRTTFALDMLAIDTELFQEQEAEEAPAPEEEAGET
jgi:prepilin-type N-terminal cleavage/methylation domain-containing protein